MMEAVKKAGVKNSVSMKERWKDPDYRDHMAVIHASNEWRRKATAAGAISGAQQRIIGSAHQINHLAAMQSEETRAAIRRGMDDPVVRERLRQCGLDRWQDPQYAETIAASSRALWDDSEFRVKMAMAMANQPRISSLQLKLYDMLDSLGVSYSPESPATVLGPYVFDCMVHLADGRALYIECQGDYWHSLLKAIRVDKAKFTYVERYVPTANIMYLWEHEFYTKDRVLDRLKLRLGVEIETIDFNFSDVVISINTVPAKDVKTFLDAYHYVGRDRGGMTISAHYRGQLIGLCVFSSPLRQNLVNKHGEFVELSRLCIHPSYHKKNFASWFVSRCLRHAKHTVVSYADTTVGHQGIVYKAANFKLSHEVPPDYWYMGEGGWVMHKRTLYGRAKSLKMTEAEFAEKHGYLKQWGGKKLCFVYAKP
jgi:GNAT superfamily N-acetyltransferase